MKNNLFYSRIEARLLVREERKDEVFWSMNIKFLYGSGLLFTALILGCAEPMEFEEAKNAHNKIWVEDVKFDVPVLYNFDNFVYTKSWGATPSKKRRAVDVIKILALLPEMEAFTQDNASEFKKLGHGKKVSILMSEFHVRWDFYFANAFRRLIAQPEDSRIPGMFHYQDPKSNMKDVYLSHSEPHRQLTQIMCANPNVHKLPSPSCGVVTRYKDQFQLNYTFALEYLEDFSAIDRNVRHLLDSFVR